jgi:hypothetical protein
LLCSPALRHGRSLHAAGGEGVSHGLVISVFWTSSHVPRNYAAEDGSLAEMGL